MLESGEAEKSIKRMPFEIFAALQQTTMQQYEICFQEDKDNQNALTQDRVISLKNFSLGFWIYVVILGAHIFIGSFHFMFWKQNMKSSFFTENEKETYSDVDKLSNI